MSQNAPFTSPGRIAAFGFFSRRERWGLTFRGWAALLAFVVAIPVLFLFTIHPFLALSAPVPSRTLVIEGWISETGIKYAAERILSNQFDHVFVTGGPISGFGGYTSDFNTYAHYGFSRLLKHGVSKESLTRVPCRNSQRDRTYSSAVVLREYLESRKLASGSINVLTDSVHARRSRLLFQAALGPEVRVGVQAVPPSDYPAKRWWLYSAGVKDVFSETLAYIYARIFF